MNVNQTHTSVILLMNSQPGLDNDSVRQWFEDSRFNTCEAEDIFQALEKLSDFTMRERPDVVLLEVDSPDTQYRLLQSVMDGGSDAGEPEVLSLTELDADLGDCAHEGSLTQLASRLEGIIPRNMSISA